MLFHDRPITRPGQDLYRRSEFALTLARAIANLPTAADGFALALTGDWGSGKSSVLYLIERYLPHIQMEQLSATPLRWQEDSEPLSIEKIEEMALLFERVEPTVKRLLESNPYYLRASLEYQFSTFQDVLKNETDTAAAVHYWHLKQKVDDRPRVIVLRFSPWLIAGRAELASALLSELARALGEGSDGEIKVAFQKLLERLALFAPIAGAGLDITGVGLGSIISSTGTAAGDLAKKMTAGPTLDELRSRLNDVLLSLNGQKILVVVDDVDRLTPSETVEMVSLVKSLGDLPNVVYLLSYDRRVLCSSLKESLRVDGEEYLEKIVQQTIELPPIDANDLLGTVDFSIRNIFKGTRLDQNRLGRFWFRVLRHYIKTPRDARRYFNSLALAEPGLGQVTDPIDLMGIQVLQVFEPQIYKLIRDNLEDFL